MSCLIQPNCGKHMIKEEVLASEVYPRMIEVMNELHASASGRLKTGAGPIATHRTGPSSEGAAPSRSSAASIVATAPVNTNSNDVCFDSGRVFPEPSLMLRPLSAWGPIPKDWPQCVTELREILLVSLLDYSLINMNPMTCRPIYRWE